VFLLLLCNCKQCLCVVKYWYIPVELVLAISILNVLDTDFIVKKWHQCITKNGICIVMLKRVYVSYLRRVST